MKLSSSDKCFACGKNNECGLKLAFDVKEGNAVSHFSLDEKFQGWKGIAHGGVVATILDEAMAWAVMSMGIKAVTVELSVKYRKPTPLNENLITVGEVKSVNRKIFRAHSKILNDEGMILAEANGVYMKLGVL